MEQQSSQDLASYIQNKKALIVEDEPTIGQLIRIHLTNMGFATENCLSAEDALEKLKSNSFEICLLDWMLPRTQGIDFLKYIKPIYPDMKIMMLTAKADPDSLVQGLDSGADEYLAKPFEAKVLQARVRHLMRRHQTEEKLKITQQTKIESDQEDIILEGLEIQFSKHIVRVENEEVHLTPSEFKLLGALIKARGQVLTRDRLIDYIQGEDVSVTGRTIDTHIFALRKKIGLWAKHIETIRGVGYRILISSVDATEAESD